MTTLWKAVPQGLSLQGHHAIVCVGAQGAILRGLLLSDSHAVIWNSSYLFYLWTCVLEVMANRTMEHETWAERGAICMSAAPCPHSYTALTMPHGHRRLVDQHWMGIQWDSKWGCGQVCFVYAWVSGDPDILERSCLQFKPEFASTVKKRDDILRNTNYQVALSYPFLLISLPCISQPLMLKMMT